MKDITFMARRALLGTALRCVPTPIAVSAPWSLLTDLVARAAVPGVRTRGSAGNGRSRARSSASKTDRRVPSRGGDSGRLLSASHSGAMAAFSSSSPKKVRWRSGASIPRQSR